MKLFCRRRVSLEHLFNEAVLGMTRILLMKQKSYGGVLKTEDGFEPAIDHISINRFEGDKAIFN